MSEIEKTLAERGGRYGDFEDCARVAQKLKSTVWESAGTKLQPDQMEALDNICSKIARLLNGDPNYRDNWDDIAGYALLVSKRLGNG